MHRHTRGFLRPATLVMLLVITALSSIRFLPATAAFRATVAAAAADDQTLVIKPTRIDRTAPEIVNPMRGLYRWMNNETVPSPNPLPQRSVDAYYRYEWSDLEQGRGEYTFNLLERDIAKAAAAGQKFAFRMRVVVPSKGSGVPSYMMDALDLGWWADTNKDGKNDTYVPDWNDPLFLDGVERLLQALGERYDNDPRVSYLDIGFFGSWGEWHTSGLSYSSSRPAKTMTYENREKLIDLHIAAFPNTPLVMLTDDERSLVYALERSPQIGWRRDSLGDEHFDSVVSDVRRLGDDKLALFSERWKTAPVITEFINPKFHRNPDTYERAIEQVQRYHVSMVSNGNMLDWDSMNSAGRNAVVTLAKASGYRFALAELALPALLRTGERVTLTSSWVNEGVAPIYEAWQTWYQLRDSGGAVVWERPSQLDLRTLLPSAATDRQAVADELLLPTSIAPGSYTLSLVVRDPAGLRAPLRLAITERQDDGSYTLGSVAVQAGRGVNVALENEVYLPALSN